MRYMFQILSVIMIIIGSCTSKSGETTVTETVQPEDVQKHEHPADITRNEEGKPEFTVSDVFQGQVAMLFTDYVAVKNSLVDSKPENAKDNAKKAGETLNKVDAKLIDGAASNDWSVYQKEIAAELKNISSTEDIEQQRQHFSKLSYSLYKAIKAFGLGGKSAFYDFCPMAFNDKGAYWLSEKEEIRNPYFGDQMLTCGSVEETLK